MKEIMQTHTIPTLYW